MSAFPEGDRLLREGLGAIFPAAAIEIRRAGLPVYARTVGGLGGRPPEAGTPVGPDTLFDLASLTKLFTTTAFLALVAAGRTRIDDPISTLVPALRGPRPIRPYEDPLRPGALVTVVEASGQVDAGAVTFRHLLSHSSGLPAWRPLYRLARGEIRAAVESTFFSYPTGTRVVYSDLGFMLLGWAIEAASGQRLDEAIDTLVLAPLGLCELRWGPVPPEGTVPTEFCDWRERRMRGEVHDENAWALHGIAGHAGLFGAAAAVAAFGQAWLDALRGARGALLPASIAQEAVSLQAADGSLRRGLGWALWSPDRDSVTHALSQRSFGHTGFTGTSLYVDPERDLVIACLTNHVFAGRETMGAIQPFRRALHAAAAARSDA